MILDEQSDIDEAESQRRSGLVSLWRALPISNVELSAKEAASTLFRFFRSAHVADLRSIFEVTCLVFFLHVLIVGGTEIIQYFLYSKPFLAVLKSTGTYIGPAIPIYGAVIAWTYLSGSSRLGIVDLFACEISTLCRVGTIFDVGKRHAEMGGSPPTHPVIFVSQENYFPVFENNSADLKLLEAIVVTNITEFYTYMKAMRDSQRRLAKLQKGMGKPTESASGAQDLSWTAAVASAIYMLFLGFESARKAIKYLIEFEPTRAETVIVILLTELVCYAFLLKHFENDELRRSRLNLRARNYRYIVPRLYHEATADHGKNQKYWLTAKETASELARRYKETFGEDLDAQAAHTTGPLIGPR